MDTSNGFDKSTLEKTLDAALEGDILALEALRNSFLRDMDTLGHTLPVLSALLRESPIPQEDCNFEREPTSHEVLINIVLQMLYTAGEEAPHQMKPLVQSFFLTYAENILCWMAHLFHNWLFRRPRPLSEKNEVSHSLRRDIRIIVPALFLRIASHPGIQGMLKNDVKFGSLLAEIHLVSTRDKDGIELLHKAYRSLKSMLCANWEDGPSETIFLGTLELHSVSFAEGIVSHIRRYSKPSKTLDRCTSFTTTHSILVFLNTATLKSKRHSLLDACLQQKGIIRALVSILLNAVRFLGFPGVNDSDTSYFFAVDIVISVAEFLGLCFRYGGPSVLAVALEYDLLSLVVRLSGLLKIQEHAFLGTVGLKLEAMADSLFDLVIPIIRFAAYPSVLHQVHGFLRDYQDSPNPDTQSHSKPAKLRKLLRLLRVRFCEEFNIIDDARMLLHEVVYSYYSDPYKFCDNSKCPSKSLLKKLGYCSKCTSAYYCSRQCQKSGWMSGHRKECKEIVTSTKDGREGFPPVLSSHDVQYMHRMAVPRLTYLYKTKPLDPSMSLVNEQAIFTIDLTDYPIQPRYATRDALEPKEAQLDDLNVQDLPGPILKVKYPQGMKLNKDLLILEAGVKVTPP